MLDDVRARTLRVERTPGIPISPHARRGENGLPDRFLGPGVANARRHAPKGQRGGGRMKHYEAAEARNQFRTNMSVGMERARYDELLNQAREKFPHATAHAPTRPALANKRVGGNQDSAAAGIPSPHALHRKIYRPKTFTNDDHYLMHLENVAMVHSPTQSSECRPPEGTVANAAHAERIVQREMHMLHAVHSTDHCETPRIDFVTDKKQVLNGFDSARVERHDWLLAHGKAAEAGIVPLSTSVLSPRKRVARRSSNFEAAILRADIAEDICTQVEKNVSFLAKDGT